MKMKYREQPCGTNGIKSKAKKKHTSLKKNHNRELTNAIKNGETVDLNNKVNIKINPITFTYVGQDELCFS